MKDKYVATVVSHTHWDRAWYVPFQEFRFRLARHVDRLLDLLDERADFRCFMLDGQTVVLEDYLDIRPYNRERLWRFIEVGRIQVGPWYVLPDEYLEGPEAMVRNLMLGHQISDEMGGVFKIGYTPDAFGHIAQLPQILAGFGIDNAIFWRGMGPEGEELGNEFIWRAPDGTKALAIWLADSYSNASFVGYPGRWGDFTPDDFSMEKALADLRRAIESLKPRSRSNALVLMDGVDHMPPQEEIPRVVKLANQVLEDTVVRQGTLLDHIQQVRRAGIQLPEWAGEFNRGYYDVILEGVYSTRVYLKQANYRAERLLVRYAEPLSWIAWLTANVSGWQEFLWQAWRYVLKSHPHDDICGCSVDETHADDLYRFRQATEIGEVVARESLRALGRQLDTTGQEGVPFLVYNPLGWPRREMLTTALPFGLDEELADDFRIVDHAGRLVPFQVLKGEEAFWSEPLHQHVERHVTVAMPAEVPACGYQTYYLQPAGSASRGHTWPQLRVGERGAENDLLGFEIAADGSMILRDKRSGLTYRGLNRFEDTEDAGDEYSYSPAPESQTVTSQGVKANITPLHVGPLQATFRVDLGMEIPQALREDLEGRIKETVILPVSSEITLYAGQPEIYIRTTVDNRARDHRLRALFPTSHRPKVAHADGHFTVLERDIDLPSNEGWMEGPVPTKHQLAFVDLSDDIGGIALLNRGLPEYEARREEDGTATLCLTLLRCVGVLGRGPVLTRRAGGAEIPISTPDAQCPGQYTFEYALLPHAGDWHTVYPTAYAYNAPLRATRIARQSGPYPDVHSFVALEPQQLVLSGLKRSERGDGLIVRSYNVTGEPLIATLSFGFPVQTVWRANLNEERLEELALTPEGIITLAVGGHEVVTVEVIPQRKR